MKNKGIFIGLSAAFCFAIMNVLVKMSSGEFSPSRLMFARGLIGMVMLTPFVMKDISRLFDRKSVFLWVRFFAGAVSGFAIFYNVQISGPAAGLALGKIEAIFVVILSLIFFRDYPKIIEWIGIGLILTGVFTLHAPYIMQAGIGGVGIGLTGALLGGIALTALKKIANDFSPLLIVWGLCFTSTLVFLFIPGDPWIPVSGKSLLFLCSTGLLGGIGQVFLTKSYALLPAPIASVLNLSSILWCVLIECCFLGAPSDTTSFFCYGLILAGLTGLQLKQFRPKKEA